jgi:glycosyltransferase involved in cell wall biosynthesis
MKTKINVSAVVLTKNEDKHIERLIKNIIDFFSEIIVIDSYSTDKTIEILESYNIKYVQNKFLNFSDQRNFAINNNLVSNNWIFFIDADELIDEELKLELRKIFSSEITQSGFYINRKFIFMNKWIRYGGYYPTYLLRLFDKNKATSMGIVNEHIKVNGTTGLIKGHLIDKNLNNFSYWINKHNLYSDLESIEYFRNETKLKFSDAKNSQPGLKLFLKHNLFNKIPLFFRVFIYFIYRYFIKLGFLDGYVGLIYHISQGFIFWFFVDIKIYELKNKHEYERK